MIRRGLFIADGTSDLPLARQLEALCLAAGSDVEIVDVPADRIPGAGRRVLSRILAILAEDPNFEIIFVHRDSEDRDPAPRYAEIANAVAQAAFCGPAVAVVPVRMTEAWLLLDEDAIRLVAGAPSGTSQLGLPKIAEVERLADPKAFLKEALATASGLRGRRLKIFSGQFDVHRALLLERLDPFGSVTGLTAWKRLTSDIAGALTTT